MGRLSFGRNCSSPSQLHQDAGISSAGFSHVARARIEIKASRRIVESDHWPSLSSVCTRSSAQRQTSETQMNHRQFSPKQDDGITMLALPGTGHANTTKWCRYGALSPSHEKTLCLNCTHLGLISFTSSDASTCSILPMP